MQGFAQKLVEVINQMQRGMEQKGQEIENQEHLGQVLRTMSEIVFHMIPFLLQDIDTLVFNLPTGTTTLADGFDPLG